MNCPVHRARMYGKRLSGKHFVRETTCPGNVLSGKHLSGKEIVRETSVKQWLKPKLSATEI